MVCKIALVFCIVLGISTAYYESDSYELLLRNLQTQLRKERELQLLTKYYNLVKRSTWDSYIDNLIAQSKSGDGNVNVDQAVIIGTDGSIWTSNSGGKFLAITQAEAHNIARPFKSKDFTYFMSHGVSIAGVTYRFLRVEDSKAVYAKLKHNGAISMQSSKTAVVIAHTPEGRQQGNANKAVAVIADYLESLGM